MYPIGKYELQELEKLLSTETVSAEATIDFTHQLRSEIEKIKKAFIQEVFTIEDERHLERYIQYHQQVIIQFLDHQAVLLDENPDDPAKEHYKMCQQYLDLLLRFIERHFAKYFDQDAKAPRSYILNARKQSKENMARLKKLLRQANADAKIIELLLYALSKIADKTCLECTTYRKVMYANQVQKEIYALLARRTSSQDIDEELRLLMYYLNFNSVKAFAHHTQYINETLNTLETRTEKIEKLFHFLKRINQCQVKPGIRYNPNAPSLKDQLSGYVIEEIEYLEKLQHLNHIPTKPNETFIQGFQLRMDISVSQLALLIKVFVEIRLIQNKSVTELLKFLSKFTVTKKSESISYESFRAKFYNVEYGTKESVKLLLSRMMNYIENH